LQSKKRELLKNDIPVVIGLTQNETKQVFIDTARTKQTSIFFADQEYTTSYSMQGLDGKQMMNIEKDGIIEYPEIKLDLLGNYQTQKCAGGFKNTRNYD
jgi:dihydrofolate synthase / folylpolyglutamate synthase